MIRTILDPKHNDKLSECSTRKRSGDKLFLVEGDSSYDRANHDAATPVIYRLGKKPRRKTKKTTQSPATTSLSLKVHIPQKQEPSDSEIFGITKESNAIDLLEFVEGQLRATHDILKANRNARNGIPIAPNLKSIQVNEPSVLIDVINRSIKLITMKIEHHPEFFPDGKLPVAH